jgi:hypothetical protein
MIIMAWLMDGSKPKSQPKIPLQNCQTFKTTKLTKTLPTTHVPTMSFTSSCQLENLCYHQTVPNPQPDASKTQLEGKRRKSTTTTTHILYSTHKELAWKP